MKISCRLFLTLAVVYVAASVAVVFMVHYAMRQQALAEAQAKAKILLDHNLSIHTYFSQQLKPRILEWSQGFRTSEFFDPVWMSSTFAVREMDNYYRFLNNEDYYYKEAAVNARTPANEADPYERAFIRELNQQPELTLCSEVRQIDGKPYFVVLRRGEMMEKACLLCHSTPEAAPAQLVAHYGPERSFHRRPGEAVTAISIRVPLASAYANARGVSIALSGIFLIVLLLLFGQQVWLTRRWVFQPINRLRDKALNIAANREPLGSIITPAAGEELRELSEAFNTLSRSLRQTHDGMEATIAARTQELKGLNTRLQADIVRRQGIEQALRRSQALFDAFNDNSPAIIYVKDLEGRYLLSNQRLAQFINRPRLQIEGRSDSDFFPAELADQFRSSDLRCLAADGPIEYEEVLDLPEGRRVYLTVKFPLCDDNGLPFAVGGVSTDITQRQQSAQALRASEEQFRTLVENTPGIVYRCEPHPPWRTFYLSERMQELCGYPAGEFLSGRRVYADVILPADLSRVTAVVEEAIRQHQSFELEYRLNHADGTSRWVWERGRVFYDPNQEPQFLDGVLFDVTSRKLTEAALEEKEATFQHLFENVADIVIVHDGEHIIDGNREACLALGYDKGELQGLSLAEIAGEAQQDGFRVASGGEVGPAGQSVLKRRDGSTFPVEIHTSSFSTNGRAVKLASARNISSRLQAEVEKAALEAKLRQTQKIEALGTLAGGIAHDFNNILMVIQGYAEVTKQNLPRGSSERENLVEVLRATNRARELVRQILTFSRRSSGEPKPVLVKSIVLEALRMLRSMLPTTIDIVQTINSDGCVIMDPSQLHQIIINLCTNAFQAMREQGGVLRVSLDDAEFTDMALARQLDIQPGKYLHLTVSDTGSGIPTEIMNRIFEPYFTTKEVGAGTGLGLAVVHGIVKEQKGAIVVESSPQKGTTFQVYLPSLKQMLAEPPSLDTTTAVRQGREHILFVDDEPALRHLLKNILTNLGYEVTTCATGDQALELCRRQPEAFDLVITDHTMPGLTGFKLAQEILRLSPHKPIILCTGFNQDLTVEEVKKAGIRELILKPLVVSELAEKLQSIFTEKPALQH